MHDDAVEGRTVVLLGRRGGATRAARRMGLTVLQIADGPSERVGPRRWTAPFRDEVGIADLAAELSEAAGARGIDAVVALTEAAVLPAAGLRAALGVDGQGVDSALACSDKVTMKRAARAAGLSCADFVAGGEESDAATVIDELGLPLVVKPRASSGSRDTFVARERADVPDELPADLMAESFVTGVEMSVESFVQGGRVIFENPTEYLRPGWANVLPAELDATTWSRVQAVSRTAIEALGVTDGITHCEVYIEPDVVHFGELAARPPGGHILELMSRAYDFDPWEVLLRLALGLPADLPTRAQRTAGVWLFHPGEGRLTAVTGLDRARELPGVVDLPFRAAVGDDVGRRVGVGQELGHVMVVGRNRDEAARRLETAHDTVRLRIG